MARRSTPLTILLAVVAAALSWLDWSVEPADYSYFAQAGSHLLRGELSDVYRSSGNQGGPFELLSASLLYRLPGRTGLFAIEVVGAALLVLATSFGVRLLRRRTALSPAPVLCVALAAVVAVWEVPGYALDGHAAEVVIPVMWVVAGLMARDGRPELAALVLGLSAGWETWGALGIPILLVGRVSPRQALRCMAIAAAAAGVTYLPFVLSGRFAMFEHHWQISVDTLPHLLGYRGGFSWWMRLVQGLSCVALGSAVAWRSRGGRHAVWLVPLAIADMRLLLDPVSPYGYYFVLPQLLALTGVALLDREPRLLKVATVAVAYAHFLLDDRARLPLLALSVLAIYFLAGPLNESVRASTRAVAPATR